jgi:hypothetical protein
MFQSLYKALQLNGRSVSRKAEEVNEEILENLSAISEEDEAAGYIYVLSSLSQNDEIKKIKNLYKIGFSKNDVAERIKNAEKESTYLCAPVKIQGAWKCINMNPQMLEKLLHNFFGNSCLNIDIIDNNGFRQSPREWFIAPLDVIEKAIEMIINGGITNYVYNPDEMKMELK